MKDIAEKWSDKQLLKLEREIRLIFKAAIVDTNKISKKLFESFAKNDAKKRELLKQGSITQKDYDQWLKGQLFQKKRYDTFIKQYTDMINKYDINAIDLINNESLNIFAQNANYIAYNTEIQAKIDDMFTLWDKNTVKKLVSEDSNILPTKALNIKKNNAWNQKAIRRQLTQGIIQGESIDKIAKRMQTVTDMNNTNALRNARTAVTGAQNAGRQARMEESVELGLKPFKEWISTKDRRTRDTHVRLNGQTVEYDKPFKSDLGDIFFPGDINAKPANVYNCRCTMKVVYKDLQKGTETKQSIDKKYKKFTNEMSI